MSHLLNRCMGLSFHQPKPNADETFLDARNCTYDGIIFQQLFAE